MQNSPSHSKLVASMEPFVNEIKNVLDVVGSDASKLSEADRKKKLDACQTSIQGLAESMAKRGGELLKENEDEKTSLLMGVLLSKQKDSMEEQYKVLEAKEFSHLAVVKAVGEKKGSDTRPLVVQSAEYLDGAEKKSSTDKNDAPKAVESKAEPAKKEDGSSIDDNSASKEENIAKKKEEQTKASVLAKLQSQITSMETNIEHTPEGKMKEAEESALFALRRAEDTLKSAKGAAFAKIAHASLVEAKKKLKDPIDYSSKFFF